MNAVHLIGRITQDVDLRERAKTKIAQLRLAVPRGADRTRMTWPVGAVVRHGAGRALGVWKVADAVRTRRVAIGASDGHE